ncbi:MAG: D-glycero-beta-D-manno-heptose-7-phosphate kinase [Candidatus Omnitrophica bacterium]|nr:D-glycero-beta-D-manno-heptose-7-phosphate kinase [Candidatus Omnitrophota bacterium]
MKDLTKIITKFAKARVLVIGDLILDEYIWGDVERISPEAPVPVVWAKKRTFVPGGAANVASNLRSLGAQVTLAGVVGKDVHRDIMLKDLAGRGISTQAVIEEAGRVTTLKSRIFARHQQVVRVDWEHVDPIGGPARERLLSACAKGIKKSDAVIIEDYGKGIFTNGLLAEVIALARSQGKIIAVDPKEDNFESYQGVTAITPNRKEAQNAIRYLKMKDDRNEFKIYHDGLASAADVKKAGYAILRHLNLTSLLITLGEQGMWLFTKDGDVHIPTVAQEVFDVSGAGDTVIATFTLGLCADAPAREAAHIANFAAGIVVGKVGTATTTRSELIERIKQFHGIKDR